jgi:hypothetical protein
MSFNPLDAMPAIQLAKKVFALRPLTCQSRYKHFKVASSPKDLAK